MEATAQKARNAYLKLLGCTEDDRNKALRAMRSFLSRKSEAIFEANRRDLDRADALVASGELSPALRARLVFNEKKLEGVLEGLEQVGRLPDPTGKVLWIMELDDGLLLKRLSCPLGVVGVIFESRPDVVVQVSGLLLKAGNAGLLKGGKEAAETNRVLMDAIREGLGEAGTVPVDSLQMLGSREEVKALLSCDRWVDLLIPRGGKELVQFIQDNTSIPVLGHTDGICHVYIHGDADPDKAVRVAVDAKTDYPAVCNAAETILIDSGAADAILPRLAAALSEKGVEIRGCGRTKKRCPGVVDASDDDWSTEYLDLIVSIKVVDGLEEAIAHINRYGSHHTDTIITENSAAASEFCRYVDSAGVFVNASTRFADGFRYGLGAEIGISTNKIHARGPVGLDGIVTYKYELQGAGHVAGGYGPGRRQFTHRILDA